MLREIIEEMAKDLNLTYHHVMNRHRAIQIVLSMSSLVLGIFLLAKGTTNVTVTLGILSLAFFTRIIFGPVMHRELTPDSQARLNEYLEKTFSDATKPTSSDHEE